MDFSSYTEYIIDGIGNSAKLIKKGDISKNKRRFLWNQRYFVDFRQAVRAWCKIILQTQQRERPQQPQQQQQQFRYR